MQRRLKAVAPPFVLAALAGCGLIQINGKPLGSMPSVAGTSAEPPSATSTSASAPRPSEPETARPIATTAAARSGHSGDDKATKLVHEGNEIVNRLREAARNDQPVAQADLTALRAAAEQLASTYPDHATYFRVRAFQYAAMAGLQALAKQQPDLLRKAVSAQSLVAHGTSDPSRLQVSFAGKAGWCYAVMTTWTSQAGRARIEDYNWTATRDISALQRFWIRHGELPIPENYGVCFTAPTTARLELELDVPGTQNRLHYAVVGWEKSRFPVELTPQLSVGIVDPCDVEAWARMWTDPVPGSLLYNERGEPHLVWDGPPEDDLWLTLIDISRGSGNRERKPAVSSTPPQQVAFATGFSPPGCAQSQAAQTPQSKALAQCQERVVKKFDGPIIAAERARDEARTEASYEAALRRIARLNEEEAATNERECGAMERAMEKAARQQYDAVVDRFATQPVVSKPDRAGLMQALYRALSG